MGPYRRTNFLYTTDSLPKINAYTSSEGLYQLVQRIVKFEGFFFVCVCVCGGGGSLTWKHMGVNVSNDISSEIHQIYSPNFMYAHGEGLYHSW